jgi:hypothetical protein
MLVLLGVILIFEVSTLNILGDKPFAGLNGDSDVGFFLLTLKLMFRLMHIITYDIKHDKGMI